ncbi:probable CD2 antigen cytoplasmic tail-binding protein 2 homolog [Coccomyxa sp. Obi]|nr:probable CD2 antigen cytoplasmic tail-binding protein 2 homolog [Coccomyxa sp. Obi]
MSGKRKAETDGASMDTDKIVQEALREVEERKKAKKQAQTGIPAKDPSKKGKTLEELEQEEGGIIKESQVPMAQLKRAQKRKGKGQMGETELVGDEEIQEVEEALEVEEEDGITLEPFNLAQERRDGYFDEGGHYVEHKNKDEEEVEKDAWFADSKDKVVSAEVRRKIEEQQAREAAAEAAPAMSGAQAAALKRQIADLLQPGETVTEALKRLRPPAPKPVRKSKKNKQQPGEKAEKPQRAEKTPEEVAALAAFNTITEAASALMDSGELDVYSTCREEFQRAAALFAPAADIFADADGDEDMFGDDFAAAKQEGAGPSTGGPSGVNGHTAASTAEAAAAAPSAAAPATTATQAAGTGLDEGTGPVQDLSAVPPASTQQKAVEEVDYGSWPIKELRRFLTERGQDPTGIVEKNDLVAKVKELAERGPDGELPAEAPAGYTFDPSSGYFYNAESGLYYDASSGGYYSGSTSKWYNYDAASGQYHEWAGAGS